MYLRVIFLAVSLFLASVLDTLADSPLTSISFSSIYSDEQIVQHALQFKKMDCKVIDFLLDEHNALEVKICVVNAIGFSLKASNKNSNKLLSAILKKYDLSSIKQIDEQKYAPLLCIYSYSLALEKYLDVGNALALARKAESLDGDSSMVQFISKLILSQHYFLMKSWCEIYGCYDDFRRMDYFQHGPASGMLRLTDEYVKSYKRYCKE